MSSVNHPFHYNQYKYEVIELVRHLPFDAGNCAKYIIRAPFKRNCYEDLAKALWYAEDMLNPSSSILDLSSDRAKYDSIMMMTDYYCSKIKLSDIPCKELFSSLLSSVVCYSIGASTPLVINDMRNNIKHLCAVISSNKFLKEYVK